MWWKIILEIVIGFAVLGLGMFSWSIIKAPSFQLKLLSNIEEINSFMNYIGKENFINEGNKIEPISGSYENNVLLYLQSSIKGLENTRNIIFFIVFILFVISCFLGIPNLLINIGLFFLSAFLGIHSSIKNSIIIDIHSVMLNIFKWNKEDPKGCRKFCTNEKVYLKNLHKIILKIK